MRNTVVKKILANNQEDNFGWSKSSKSIVMLKVDHLEHLIEFETVSGRSLSFNSFMSIILNDKDVKKELTWALTEYVRKYPISISTYSGDSGCYDFRLRVHPSQYSWVRRYSFKNVLHIHVSMYNNLNEGLPSMFSGDLLEALGWFLFGENKEEKVKFCKNFKNKKYMYELLKSEKYKHKKDYKYIYTYKTNNFDFSMCGVVK